MIWLPILIFLLLLPVLLGYILSVRPYQGPVSDHFDGKVFKNPSGREANGIEKVFRYMRENRPDPWPDNYEDYVRQKPLPQPPAEGLQLVFINHSTFLLQYRGLNILTDPIWSKRCSPFQWAGPHRKRPPGLDWDALPHIDLVLLSHNHYDHLDAPTIKRLHQKQSPPQYIVPLGLSDFVRQLGATAIVELDWWQSHDLGSLKVKALPANHFSSRGLFDRDKTLWAGYMLEAAGEKIYFVGDTGYSDIFKKIGAQEGPIDLALVPIGAYLPKWFMSPIHISPEEAAQVHLDLGVKQSMAMHFGTFPLAGDNPERSARELRAAMLEKQIATEDFMIPEEGFCYRWQADTGLELSEQ